MNLGDQTVWGVLDSACLWSPDKELLVVDGARYTYREVRDRAGRLADSFVNLGLGLGDVIGLWLPNGLEWIVSFFAAARIGAITFGINTRLRIDEVAFLLSQSQAKALMVSHLPASLNYIEATYQLIPELRGGKASLHSLQFPRFSHVICTGNTELPGMLLWRDLLEGETKFVRSEDVTSSTVALLQYTSGSTGQPKGAKLIHGAITRNGFGTGERMGLNRNDKLFAPNPFFHVAGTVTGLLNVVTHRATLVTMAHYEAGKALEVLEHEQCTARLGLDAMYQRELEHPDFSSRDLQALRKGVCMGAPHIFRQAYDRMGISDIISIYALSEASPNVASTVPTDSLDVRASTVGKPQAGVELKLAHLDSKNPVALGDTGEIMVRGWNVMEGYFNDPAATAQAIDEDGWLHTGDLGRFDSNWNLIFVGRLKDVIRVGGENVSAQEVENVLLRYPDIKMAQVVAILDRDLGEVPFAFIELHPNASCTEQELTTFCRERLARFKIPRVFHFVDEWPTTGSGKIQKVILRERAASSKRRRGS
jgi:fatty-acyl-CoA synthase